MAWLRKRHGEYLKKLTFNCELGCCDSAPESGLDLTFITWSADVDAQSMDELLSKHLVLGSWSDWLVIHKPVHRDALMAHLTLEDSILLLLHMLILKLTCELELQSQQQKKNIRQSDTNSS